MRGAVAAALVFVVVGCGSIAPTPTPTASSFAQPGATPTANTTTSPVTTPLPTPTQRPTESPSPTSSPTSGCAAAGPALVWDVGPYACTSAPVNPLPAQGRRLKPGIFTKGDFRPELTFAVGKGWTTEQQAPGFFDIEDEPGSLDVVAVQFANVVGAATASAAAAAISEAGHISATAVENVVVDGRPALRLVAQTRDPADTDPPLFRPVMSVPAGPLSIASGRRLQVTLLDVDGGVLAILVGGSIAEWDRALDMATPVVESVTIGG